MILIGVISINYAFAVISYPSNDQRLKGLPTYCVVEPSGLSATDRGKYVNMAKEGIAEWSSELQGIESQNPEVWKITTKVITNNESTFDCDITIYFKETVDQIHKDKDMTTLGIFSPSTQSIDISYSWDLETIYNIILHEIGHSFGLGHYFSDDDEINKEWYSGEIQSPSIMIPIMNRDPSLMAIMQVDLQKIHSIYGTNGFYAFSPEPIPTPLPTPKPIIPSKPIIPEKPIIPSTPIIPVKPFKSMQISEDQIFVSKYDIKYVKITGQLEGITTRVGLPVYVIIKYPDNSFQTHEIRVSKTGYFELPLVFDGNSKKGQYEVEASYLDHMDYGMNFHFYVGDKQTSNAPENYYAPKSNPISDNNGISGKYLENITIQVENNQYTVKSDLGAFLSTSVRITAENECPFKKQVFQQDYRDGAGTKVSFSFYQLSNGKPDTCSINFSIADFNGNKLDSIKVNYNLQATKKQPTQTVKPFEYKKETLELQKNADQKINSLKSGIASAEKSLKSTNYKKSQAKEEVKKAWDAIWWAKKYLGDSESTQKEGSNFISKSDFKSAYYKYKYSFDSAKKIEPYLFDITKYLNSAKKLEK